MAIMCKKWTLARKFHGEPRLSDFKMVEEGLSTDLKPGEILVEALYLSVDPYMRFSCKIGNTLIGEQVARIQASNNPEYPEDSLVVAFSGWRSHARVPNPKKKGPFGSVVRRLPDFGGLPPSLGIGCLGMPGLTAYFGLLDQGQVKAGEMVLVNAAAGAVGSVVGQLAKIKGCTVIGSTGCDEKCDWLKEIGFDHVFNYKTRTVDEALKEFAPRGVDVFYDNVGGDYTYDVMKNHMKVGGRVVECGSISCYNDSGGRERSTAKFVADKQLVVRAVNVSSCVDSYPPALTQLLQWVKEGKLKYKETITQGFENMPSAFISLFHGANIGKAVVKV